MMALDLPLLHHLHVNVLPMGPCTLLPCSDGPLIAFKRMNDRLAWASIGQQRYYTLYLLLIGTQSFKHGTFSLTKCFPTRMTLVPWSFATMNTAISCPDLASCTTRLIGAKLSDPVVVHMRMFARSRL